ncbi:MAG: hypothetical protein IJ366_00545 [Clostridia bacterium]|nr:hypothetical protein [Clostridia bacterium]MBQ7792986.1 hypothetical protein [Clostridia bacterium]
MADKAHILTDKKLAEMEKHLSAIYRRAEKELGESWKKYLSESTAEIDELQKAYDKAKQGGDKAEIKKKGVALSRAKKKHTVQNKWYKERTEQLARDIANVNQTALAYINGQLPEVYSLNYNAIAPDVEGMGGYSFSLVDADTVRNLSLSDDSLLPTKELNIPKDVRWNVRKMNAEVLQGILQGETMDEIAGRMSKVFGMNENSAITNARTMVTGAENKGRMDSYTRAEADGIILDKQWIATNDRRTRHSHRNKPEGVGSEIVGAQEPFSNGLMYPGDPNGEPSELYNCRCTVVSIVKGFKKRGKK